MNEIFEIFNQEIDETDEIDFSIVVETTDVYLVERFLQIVLYQERIYKLTSIYIKCEKFIPFYKGFFSGAKMTSLCFTLHNMTEHTLIDVLDMIFQEVDVYFREKGIRIYRVNIVKVETS